MSQAATANERPTVVDADDIITIKPSPTADTRSCDWSKVSKDQLCDSSIQHREDVVKGFDFFQRMMRRQARLHDHDKLSDIDGFHSDFKTGFEKTEWWDKHRKINRHHLLQEDGVPEDVNLIDVLDMVVDCTMAGLARTGEVYPLELSPDVLVRAFQNTCELLKAHIVVDKGENLGQGRGIHVDKYRAQMVAICSGIADQIIATKDDVMTEDQEQGNDEDTNTFRGRLLEILYDLKEKNK